MWNELVKLGQIGIMGMGIAALAMAAYFLWFFWHSDRPLSRAMRALMLEQIISSLGTCLFSLNSLSHSLGDTVPSSDWNSIPPELAQFIRFAMFAGILHSTWRLSVEVDRVNRQLEDQ